MTILEKICFISIIIIGLAVYQICSNGSFRNIDFKSCLGCFWYFLSIIAILGLGVFVIYSGGWLGVITVLLVLLLFK